jgi:NAD(P)-dependent dehydrogenase (short-subunit alcohol dehydrogenase family)
MTWPPEELLTITIDLTGRRALVTGAGQGVGRGIAKTLAAAGAQVLVNDLVQERAASVVAEIEAAGGVARTAVFDVTDWDAVHSSVDELGPVDLLVNNAGNAGKATTMGFEEMKAFAQEDPAAWEGFIRVNLLGVMYVTRAVLPGMIDGGAGRVITIISDTARTGELHMAAYSAAKAGAAGLMRSVASEVARHGITANCIALGSINQMERPAEVEQEELGYLIKRYPIRRRGLPSDIANLTLFLASDLSPWITGQTIPVNGGYSMAL